jgi:hypothetical protein
MNYNTDDCFLLENKNYRTAYDLHKNNNYTFSLEYHNLHMLVSISSFCWYENHTEILKYIVE